MYFFILEKSAENAHTEVKKLLDSYNGRGWFDEYTTTSCIPTVTDHLENAEKVAELTRARVADMSHELVIGHYENEREFRLHKGRIMRRVGDILSEQFCCDMPYFNVTSWDWYLPTAGVSYNDGRRWYTVGVVFSE